MAKFWEHLKRHEDTVEKRPITVDELKFLSELQKEMNEQDTCSTADPRYWVIRDFEKVYGESLNHLDGITLFDEYNCSTVYEGKFDNRKILDELIERYEDDFSNSDFYEMGSDKEDLSSFLEEKGYEDIKVLEYMIVSKKRGFYFTEKAAREHLEKNFYHYSEEATTYCEHSNRNPETEKLWKILHEVDFQSIIMHLEGAGNE